MTIFFKFLCSKEKLNTHKQMLWWNKNQLWWDLARMGMNFEKLVMHYFIKNIEKHHHRSNYITSISTNIIVTKTSRYWLFLKSLSSSLQPCEEVQSFLCNHMLYIYMNIVEMKKFHHFDTFLWPNVIYLHEYCRVFLCCSRKVADVQSTRGKHVLHFSIQPNKNYFLFTAVWLLFKKKNVNPKVQHLIVRRFDSRSVPCILVGH